MTRLLFIILTLFSSTYWQSQSKTFSQRVNDLFFGVEISNKSVSIFDSLLSVPQLHHSDNVKRQRNLNVTMEMNSEKAWSSRHLFFFTESSFLGLEIEKGTIEVTIGETDSIKKILSLNWQIQFKDKISAAKYFDKLKQSFGELATKKKFDKDKDLGEIAQYSTRNAIDTGVRDITLFLTKSPITKKYEISLEFGNEFMDE